MPDQFRWFDFAQPRELRYAIIGVPKCMVGYRPLTNRHQYQYGSAGNSC